MGSQESAGALPTSVPGDFYSPEALRRRLAPQDDCLLELPSASSPGNLLVKQPPPVIRQRFTDADWAAWAAVHGVRMPGPLQLVLPAKAC